MPIVIGFVVLVVVAIVAIVASQKFRGQALDALGGTWDYIVAHRPDGTSILSILRPIGWTLFGFLMLMIISWIVFFVLMLYVGIKADAVGSAIIIAFLFPAWCMLRIFKPRKILSETPPRRNIIWRFLGIPYRLASAVLLFVIPFLVIGTLLHSKGSTGRLARNAKQGIANSMDERSSKSEREAGKFALVRENVVLTDSPTGGSPVGEATKGTVVRVLDINTERVASDESEGKLRVMLPNKFKGYDQGQTGYIPTRALDFDWEKKYSGKEDTEIHSVKVVMNDPNGVRIEVPEPGLYRFWAEDTPRLQALDRPGGRVWIQVWPDGRTLEQITPVFGGRPGYYERMGHWNKNPIPGAPTFPLIVWGKNGAVKTFQKGGIPIEIEVAKVAIIDENVPRGDASWFVNNGGENTIYYQRRG